MAVKYVIKKSGRKQRFKKSKLYKSIRKAGAASSTARKVANSVAKRVKNNMRTSKIRVMVARTLKKYNKTAAKAYMTHKKRRKKKR